MSELILSGLKIEVDELEFQRRVKLIDSSELSYSEYRKALEKAAKEANDNGSQNEQEAKK